MSPSTINLAVLFPARFPQHVVREAAIRAIEGEPHIFNSHVKQEAKLLLAAMEPDFRKAMKMFDDAR